MMKIRQKMKLSQNIIKYESRIYKKDRQKRREKDQEKEEKKEHNIVIRKRTRCWQNHKEQILENKRDNLAITVSLPQITTQP